MTTYIIYHQVKPGIDCPDGIAAAVVAKRKYPDATLMGWTYQSEELPDLKAGDKAIIVDFSFSASVMQNWADAGVDLTVIDHHATALNNLSGLSDRILAKFDMSECGATLTWKTLFPDQPLPAVLEYVRDRDLWDFLLPETNEVHEAMAALRRPIALIDRLLDMTREELLWLLLPIGQPLVAPKRQKVEEIASRFQWMSLPEHPEAPKDAAPVVVLAKDGSEDRYVSDVCMFLYRQIPEALFTACITSDGSWSLRSDKHGSNTDVRAIAELYSGGGHRNSAGFRPRVAQ